MGKSRYNGTEILDNNHYGTWDDPTNGSNGLDILANVDTVDHIIKIGERLDTLAYVYYGDSDYWWIIALANRIIDPFSISPGDKLRIPRDAKTILDKVRR